MEVQTIFNEIKRLSISDRMWLFKETKKMINKETLSKDKTNDDFVISEVSLGKEWLSKEEDCWDTLTK